MEKIEAPNWPATSRAVSMLVGTSIIDHLSSYRMFGWHPEGESHNAYLRLADTYSAEAPVVAIGQWGDVWLKYGDGTKKQVVASMDTEPYAFQTWARGDVSIDSVVRKVLDALDHDCSAHRDEHTLSNRYARARLVSEIARQAALFGIDLEIQSNASNHDVLADEGSREFLAGRKVSWPGEVWTFTAQDRQVMVVAGLDVWRLGHVEVERYEDRAHELTANPSVIAGELLSGLVGGAAVASRPGLGLPAVVEAFNRKERCFLFGELTGAFSSGEIHGPGLRLSSQALSSLNAIPGLGWTVPPHAWVGIDYQLSWLHGALAWYAGEVSPGQGSDWPSRFVNEVAVVTGNQEDTDALIVWNDSGKDRLLLLEAKAYGSWGNAQMQSKVTRFNAMFEHFRDVEARLVLVSPDEPKKLITANWPRKSTHSEKPLWMVLGTSGLRTMTQRVDEIGAPSQEGAAYRVAPPFFRHATNSTG